MSAAYKIRSLPKILLTALGFRIIGGAAYIDHATG